MYKTILPALISTTLLGCAMTTDNVAQVTHSAGALGVYSEPLRPQVHFTPPAHWMNDPNGMFYHDGEYHLFYQHNPGASVWGPMHWGHAVSSDLMHWQNKPIALYPDELGTIFSGSAVVDWQNSSGLGSNDNPPIVAMYTYHDANGEKQGRIDFQTQAIAYSLDKGQTWTKYAHNPVIKNPGIRDFRDPKVMWDENRNQWVMVLAQKNHVGFYRSDNLLDWKLTSTFGKNIGSHGGVWECPELLRLKVPGSEEYRYVLMVSISPGGPNGGSATQYFVGDFDGAEFTLDEQWQTMLKPTDANFPEGEIIDNFESGAQGWTIDGNAFGNGATQGGHPEQPSPQGFEGEYLLNSFAKGDAGTGSMASPVFTLNKNFINFAIGGGHHPGKVGVQLLVNGKVVREATGHNSENLRYASWDVSQWKGQSATIRAFDEEKGGWGHIYIDDIVQADSPATNRVEPAVWLDYGTDNYAGVTFFTAPQADEQRALFIGWMSNWLYANDVPTEKWRSAMTIPRELQLFKYKSQWRVKSVPVPELATLGKPALKLDRVPAHQTVSLPDQDPQQAVRFQFSVDMTGNNNALLTLSNAKGEHVGIALNKTLQQLVLDRRLSGQVDFSQAFVNPQIAPLSVDWHNIDFDIVVDRSSIEVFVNNGETVLTSLVFPASVLSSITLEGQNTYMNNLTITPLSSVWTDK